MELIELSVPSDASIIDVLIISSVFEIQENDKFRNNYINRYFTGSVELSVASSANRSESTKN